MLTVLAFIVVPVLVVLLRTPLLRVPVVFYLLSVLTSVLLVAFPWVLQSLPGFSVWAEAVSRGMVPFTLFLVVMYIGVLPASSRVRRYLMPVRGYLSICAALLACGHFSRYLMALVWHFSASVTFTTVRANAIVAISVFLTLLLAVLTVTSFGCIREKMGTALWHSVQRWAYVFLAVAFVHVLVILAPAALQGGDATVRLALYTFAVGAYILLRVKEARACSTNSSRRV